MSESKVPVPADLRARALGLSPRERLALAAELLDSVEGTDPQWEAAWSHELDRRTAEIDSGAVKPIPWSEVRAQMEAAFRKKP